LYILYGMRKCMPSTMCKDIPKRSVGMLMVVI
jgi:hypothetical protein